MSTCTTEMAFFGLRIIDEAFYLGQRDINLVILDSEQFQSAISIYPVDCNKGKQRKELLAWLD